jgi:hypothetical protein
MTCRSTEVNELTTEKSQQTGINNSQSRFITKQNHLPFCRYSGGV